MDSNFNMGQRGSMQGYPFSTYSTQYCGNDGRSTSTGHEQYFEITPRSQFDPQIPQDGTYEHTGYGVAEDLQDFELQPGPSVSQQQFTNNFDPKELHQFSVPADRAPWNHTAGRSAHGMNSQPPQHSWPTNSLVPKACTEPMDATFRRPQLPSRYSHATSPDSGFASATSFSQKLPSNKESTERTTYEHHDEGRGNLTTPEPYARAGSVKSELQPQPSEASSKRKRQKTQVSPCRACGKPLKNQSDAQ